MTKEEMIELMGEYVLDLFINLSECRIQTEKEKELEA